MFELGIGLITASLLAMLWGGLTKEGRRIENLIANGNRIEAAVVQVSSTTKRVSKTNNSSRKLDNYMYSQGKMETIEQRFYTIQCKLVEKGKTYMFMSDPLDWDPTGFVSNTIPVYVDPEDSTNYHVITTGLKVN